jgi:enoyl-CoA hydratase/carnithine racemase
VFFDFPAAAAASPNAPRSHRLPLRVRPLNCLPSEKSGPLGVKTTLESAHRARLEGEKAAFDRLESDMSALLHTEDGREGMSSFIERREARFSGK